MNVEEVETDEIYSGDRSSLWNAYDLHKGHMIFDKYDLISLSYIVAILICLLLILLVLSRICRRSCYGLKFKIGNRKSSEKGEKED